MQARQQPRQHLTSFHVQVKRVEHGRQQVLLLHLKQRGRRAEIARLNGRTRIGGRWLLCVVGLELLLMMLLLLLR